MHNLHLVVVKAENGEDACSEAARELKISGGHIREMANGSILRKKVGGFIWKYEK